MTGDAASIPPATPRRQVGLAELVALERGMRRLRIGLAAFAALQFGLYAPPPGTELPFARVPVAAAFVAALMALNLVSVAAGSRDVRRLRRVGMVELGGDTVLALTILWLFSFDAVSALWALLIVPIIEGAYRHDWGGALSAWAIAAAGFGVREWLAHRQGMTIDPASVTYRLGVLLAVAMSIGWMSRNLRNERLRSERRAELLHAVASAAPAELDSAQVLESVMDALVALGYEASNFATLSETGAAYRIQACRGLPPELVADRWHPVGGLVGAALESGETVVVDDYQHHEYALDALVDAGVQVAVAVPIRIGGGVAGVMAARTCARRSVTQEEVEALQLLAERAGRALDSARRFEAERQAAEAHRQASERDELTGLGNRRYANGLLQSVRPGDSVVMIDCDRFKAVNDTGGHAAGDAVLVAIAEYLSGAVRHGDDVARLGGDEFLVVLRGADGDALEVTRRLVDGWRARRPPATFSAGVAVHRPRRSTAVTVGEADVAAMAAKRSGGATALAFSADLVEAAVAEGRSPR